MTRTIPENAREHADLALAVYVEELAARRRVLFVGDPASTVPERLSSVARLVEVVSPRTRVRGTRRGGRISPRPWPSAQDARSWDLVLVPDLLRAGLASSDRIREMSEWLTARGVLVVGAEERDDGIRYTAFYEMLAQRFEWVRMLGQAPFAGWAVVDFEPGRHEVEVTFDGSLLGGRGEEAARYVGLCSSREVVLDPYAIIQVPAAPPGDWTPTSSERLREDAQAQTRVLQLEVELRDCQEDLGRSQARGAELERELGAARARVEHAERRLEQAQREIVRSAQKLDEMRAEGDRLSRELARAREQIVEMQAERMSEPSDDDYGRLERALSERGRELTELRAEVERRGVLVRDLIEELRELRERSAWGGELPGGASGAERGTREGEGRLEVEAARRRVVQAEAAVAEISFRLDEVRADLALCRKQREAERAAALRELAQAEGRARGLRARIAELEELCRLGEARLTLALDDVSAHEARVRELERELEETRDRLRAAFVRPPPGAHGVAADLHALQARYQALVADAAEREGRLYGALLQARETAADLQAERKRLMTELARVRSERETLETRVAQLAAEARTAAAEAEQHLKDLAVLRSACEDQRRELQELRGECDGLRLRLWDAEEALAAVRAVSTGLLPSESSAFEELRKRFDELAVQASEWARREGEAAARADREARRAAALADRLGVRDALIARVQSQLCDALERNETLERRTRELEASVGELRDALSAAQRDAEVRAEEERRETRRIEERLAEAEAARQRAEREDGETREALRDTREILAQIVNGLEGSTLAGSTTAPASGMAEAHLREEIERLRREMEDREVLLRSLTAQLQDRDDRLRALDRLYRGEGSEDASKLMERMLLAEERATRLERELEQERMARRAAEASMRGSAEERDAELRRLHQMLGDRDAKLMVLEGRLAQCEREGRAMRETFAEARAGLESLLGEIAQDRSADAADRISRTLRLLQRY